MVWAAGYLVSERCPSAGHQAFVKAATDLATLGEEVTLDMLATLRLILVVVLLVVIVMIIIAATGEGT